MHFRWRSLITIIAVAGWSAAGWSAAGWSDEAQLVRITEEEAKKLVVSKVDPEYPAMAKQMHLVGRVVVDIFIGEDGKVEKVETVNGNPLLSGAAVAAVKKWKFTPFSSGGHTRKAVTSLGFNFKL